MAEQSNNEILRDYARSTDREIFENEIPYPKSGAGIIQKFKRLIYIPYNNEKHSFFIWYSDPYARIGIPTVFCGAFIPIPSSIKAKINIRKRLAMDKLNFFSKTKENETGIEYFDSKVVIKGSPGLSEKKFLSHSRIQNYILEALDSESLVNISINEFNIDFIPELKNKSYLSVINPQTWILERDYINQTFRQIEKIRNVINE